MDYHIVKNFTKENHYILTTSYISPFDDIDELQGKLKELGVSGKVIVDLLGCNGTSSNRFFLVCVSPDFKVDMNSLKQLNTKDLPTKYKQYACDWFRKNPDYFCATMLSNAQIFLIKSGENI